jgi:hypothetical protein
MFTVMMLAAAAAMVGLPSLAQESKMTLGEGEAVLISPDGTVHKSNTRISDANHEAAVAKGANEVSQGTVFYRRGGKLFNVMCTGTYIGGWKEGYPSTEYVC